MGLEKEMATHSSTLAWNIPWTEQPDRLQSTGSQIARHDLVTEKQTPILSEILTCLEVSAYNSTGEGNGTPLQYSCLENRMDGGAWWAAVWGCTESDMIE